MFVNHNLKFVYVSVTKSGSSSIVGLLRKEMGGQDLGNTKRIIPSEYDDYYSFIVVRNPYARMVSWWWAICKDGGDRYGHKKELQNAGLTESLHDFLILWEMKGDYSQAHYLNVNKKFDKILKLENIKKDFNTLPFIKTYLEIPRANSRKHPTWEELLDSESGKLINRIYGSDFEKLNYEKIAF